MTTNEGALGSFYFVNGSWAGGFDCVLFELAANEFGFGAGGEIALEFFEGGKLVEKGLIEDFN